MRCQCPAVTRREPTNVSQQFQVRRVDDTMRMLARSELTLVAEVCDRTIMLCISGGRFSAAVFMLSFNLINSRILFKDEMLRDCG